MNIKALLFNNRGFKQTIFKNTFWLMIAEAATKGVGFLILVWLARHFGPEIYGKWAFALSFVTIFSILADFGFSILTVREIARDKLKSAKYIDNIVVMKLVLGFLSLGLMALIIQFLSKDPETVKLVYFLGIYIILNTFATFFQSIFRANEKMQYETTCRILQSLSLVILAAFFILNKGSILTISYAYVGAVLIGVVFSLLFVWRYFTKFFLAIDFQTSKKLLKEAWPFGVSSFAIALYFYSSSVILGIMRSNAEVGFYNAGFRIISALFPIVGILSFSFFPQMSRAFKENYNKFRNIIAKYTIVMFGVGLPFGIGGFIVAPELINFFYGEKYLQAVIPFQILVWFLALNFISSTYSNSLFSCDKQKYVLRATIIGALFNIILNLIFIPKYGIIGAAVIMVLTEAVIFFNLFIILRKTIKINLLRSFLLPFSLSILMALCLVGAKGIGITNPIFLILIGAVVYAVLFYFVYYKNRYKFFSS